MQTHIQSNQTGEISDLSGKLEGVNVWGVKPGEDFEDAEIRAKGKWDNDGLQS